MRRRDSRLRNSGMEDSKANSAAVGETAKKAHQTAATARTLRIKSFHPVTMRSTLNANHLHNELLRKKLECEHLGRKNKFLNDELRMEKYVTRKLAAEKVELLETKQKVLVGEQERLKQQEKDAIERAYNVATELEETKQQLDDVKNIAEDAKKEKEGIAKEMEKIRLENKALVEEKRRAKIGEIEATRRADAAERQAAEQAQRRWRLETQTKLTLSEIKQIEEQLEEARKEKKAVQDVLDEIEKTKSQRQNKGTQTAVRACLHCAANRSYRGVCVLEQCQLLKLHGLRRELYTTTRGHHHCMTASLPHLQPSSQTAWRRPPTYDHTTLTPDQQKEDSSKKSPSPVPPGDNFPSPREDNLDEGRLNISISLPSPRKLPKRASSLRYAFIPVEEEEEEDGDVVEVFEY